MKNKLALLTITALTTLLIGCKSPAQVKAWTKVVTSSAAYYGLVEQPLARPYVALAATHICAAAATNASPKSVVSVLDGLPSKPEAGVLIVNSALAIWFAYQPDTPVGHAALEGTCEGLNLALASTSGGLTAPSRAAMYPHVRSRK